MKKILIIVLVSVLAGGCSHFPGGANDPIIKVSMSPSGNEFEGIATQADRRLVITREKEENSNSQNEMPAICAEPFPDGVALFNKLDKINIEINGQKLGKESGETRNVTIPFELHPALKFYRDGVFALCQAAMNGWVRVKPQLVIYKKEDSDSGKEDSGKDSNYDTVSFKKVLDYYDFQGDAKDKFNMTTQLITFLDGLEYDGPPFLSEFETQLYKLRETAENMYIHDVVARKEKAKAMQKQAEAVIEQQKTEQARIQLESDRLKAKKHQD